MSKVVLFEEANEPLFWQEWRNYTLRHHTGPKYLKENLEIQLLVSASKSLLFKDKSFVYLMDNQPVACIFLPLETDARGQTTITMSASYVEAPVCENETIRKEVFLLIDEIAKEYQVAKIMFTVDPLELDTAYNYLQHYGYLDTTLLAKSIDLGLTDDLLKQYHKRHRRTITAALHSEEFGTFVMDQANPSRQIHDEYVAFHHKCSGRVTRPEQTFTLQFDKLTRGYAALIGLQYQAKRVAYYYFDYLGKKALVYSAADDPDYDHLPLYHILSLKMMEYLKAKGVRYVDFGQPASPSPQFDYYPDLKQRNIAFFKHGLPGGVTSLFKGVKYFSPECFGEDVENFKTNYSRAVFSEATSKE